MSSPPLPPSFFSPEVTTWLKRVVVSLRRRQRLPDPPPNAIQWNSSSEVQHLFTFLELQLTWSYTQRPPRKPVTMDWPAVWRLLAPGMSTMKPYAPLWIPLWCKAGTPWHLQAVQSLLPTLLSRSHLALPTEAPLDVSTSADTLWCYNLLDELERALPLTRTLLALKEARLSDTTQASLLSAPPPPDAETTCAL